MWHSAFNRGNRNGLRLGKIVAPDGHEDIAMPVGGASNPSVAINNPRDWKAVTIEQFVAEVDAYIRWYNEKRIKISLGSLSPIEYRQSLGLNL